MTRQHFHNPASRPARGGFSLLETTIALGVLGVGLIMVAALFPVALTQHKDNIQKSQALDMTTKATAMLHNAINADRLWFDQAAFAAGYDSPWYVMAFANILVGDTWQPQWSLDQTDMLNGAPPGNALLQLVGSAVLSDRHVPVDDTQTARNPNRMLWYGFYRQMAGGSKVFCAAICRHGRNDFFYPQIVDQIEPLNSRFEEPLPDTDYPVRFPTPWRVTLSRDPGTRILRGNPNAAPIGRLAPPGSRIFIHGQTYTNTGNGVLDFPAGRILTVVDTNNADLIQVLENLNDIRDSSFDGFRFDVWLFPPPVNGKESPVLEWKVSL